MPTRATVSSLIIAAVFMGILCTLLVTHERRPFYLVRERHGMWVESFQEIETRFRKGLTLKQELVQLYNQTRYTVLDELPRPVVLPGRDGFLFYNSEEANDGASMSDWKGKSLPDEQELAAWKDALIRRDQQLAAQGIPYLLVMAPNKQTAMPTWMPRWVQAQEGRHDADVRLPAVAGSLRSPPLDLRPSLRAASDAGRETYFRTDSHWNCEGAALAAEAMSRRLAELDPRLRPLDTSTWARVPRRFQGDILRLGHLQADRFETVQLLVPPQPLPGLRPDGRPLLAPGPDQDVALPVDLWQADANGIKNLVMTNPAGIEGTLVIFHDSFGVGVTPYLGQLYRRTVCCWSPYSQPLVDRLAPRAVVQLTVERYLYFIRHFVIQPGAGSGS
jgi:alginate O-acetyltransferase complex protein AlgJ